MTSLIRKPTFSRDLIEMHSAWGDRLSERIEGFEQCLDGRRLWKFQKNFHPATEPITKRAGRENSARPVNKSNGP